MSPVAPRASRGSRGQRAAWTCLDPDYALDQVRHADDARLLRTARWLAAWVEREAGYRCFRPARPRADVMMDQTTAWLLAFVILAIAFGIYLRRRYGNLYARFSDAMERTTGVRMASIVRAIGILTLAAWVVVYTLSGSDSETGLEDLLGWFAGRSEGVAEQP